MEGAAAFGKREGDPRKRKRERRRVRNKGGKGVYLFGDCSLEVCPPIATTGDGLCCRESCGVGETRMCGMACVWVSLGITLLLSLFSLVSLPLSLYFSLLSGRESEKNNRSHQQHAETAHRHPTFENKRHMSNTDEERVHTDGPSPEHCRKSYHVLLMSCVVCSQKGRGLHLT